MTLSSAKAPAYNPPEQLAGGPAVAPRPQLRRPAPAGRCGSGSGPCATGDRNACLLL